MGNCEAQQNESNCINNGCKWTNSTNTVCSGKTKNNASNCGRKTEKDCVKDRECSWVYTTNNFCSKPPTG